MERNGYLSKAQAEALGGAQLFPESRSPADSADQD
jgi:hypothetical protein